LDHARLELARHRDPRAPGRDRRRAAPGGRLRGGSEVAVRGPGSARERVAAAGHLPHAGVQVEEVGEEHADDALRDAVCRGAGHVGGPQAASAADVRGRLPLPRALPRGARGGRGGAVRREPRARAGDHLRADEHARSPRRRADRDRPRATLRVHALPPDRSEREAKPPTRRRRDPRLRHRRRRLPADPRGAGGGAGGRGAVTSAGASVLGASREERALYAELLAVYRELVAALADPARPLDHGWLAGRHAAAETLTARLRAVATELAPHRLSGAPVAAEVAELWRGSAALAAEAARVNAEATALARARQTA